MVFWLFPIIFSSIGILWIDIFVTAVGQSETWGMD